MFLKHGQSGIGSIYTFTLFAVSCFNQGGLVIGLRLFVLLLQSIQLTVHDFNESKIRCKLSSLLKMLESGKATKVVCHLQPACKQVEQRSFFIWQIRLIEQNREQVENGRIGKFSVANSS